MNLPVSRSNSYKTAVDDEKTAQSRVANNILKTVPETVYNSFQLGSANLIEYYLEERKNEFTSPTTVNVFVGTFNVNGQEPECLDEWLLSETETADMYVIGFQELQLDTDAYAGQYIADNKKFLERQTRWEQAITKTLLKTNKKLIKLSDERLVGMYLIIFVQKFHLSAITKLDSASLGCGIMGYLGNKGGVGIRFNFYEASICFVCTHFAAHQSEMEKRNKHYRAILSGLEFENDIEIKDHTHVVWLGDLNYRIELDIDIAKQHVTEANIPALLMYDQLREQISSGQAFKYFREHPITFPPTYKYDMGTDNFDSSPKCRIPAYTDRILFYSKSPNDIVQESYDSHTAIKISDHKPVSGNFKFIVPVRDQVKFREVYREIIQEADKSENEMLPSISLSSQHIDFKDVYFNKSYNHNIQLSNTGKVPASYLIKDSREELGESKKKSVDMLKSIGIHITPMKGIIPFRGDVTVCTIQITLSIDQISVSRYNIGKDGKNPLEDIILLVQLGMTDEDRPPAVHYITFSCNFHFSCFGMPRKVLCIKKYLNVSELTYEKIYEICSADEESRGRFIPMELWKLIDEIFRRGMKEESIFLKQGVQSEVDEVISVLNNNSVESLQNDNLPGCVNTIAEVLLLFLNSMPEPIIPYSHFELCISNRNEPDVVAKIISNFPQDSQTLFEYITAFLRELGKYAEDNKTCTTLLTELFHYSLLRPDPKRHKSLTGINEKEKSMDFLAHFVKPRI